tara:strand:+ start:4731 stop:5285 length:555 start_codon:yes stop_codon:yes gene_type:complete
MGTRKPDRIVNYEDVGSEIDEAIYRALRPVDAAAVDMELKWGIDRIEQLVEPQLAAKFGTAKAQLDQAINDRDPEMVAQKGSAMIRGWNALDTQATSLGARTIADVAEAWSWKHPETGKGYLITKDNASAQAIGRVDKTSTIYTLDEVCRILDSKILVNEIKDVFPGSTVSKETGNSLNDEVPF